VNKCGAVGTAIQSGDISDAAEPVR
jgi:hypothetical protein